MRTWTNYLRLLHDYRRYAMIGVMALLGAYLVGGTTDATTASVQTVSPVILSGVVQLVSNPPKDYRNFSYAILYIDTAGCAVTNAVPMRFDLDTKELADGPHTMKVVLYDKIGKLVSLPIERIMVDNSGKTHQSGDVMIGATSSDGMLKAYPSRTYPTVYLGETRLPFDIPPFIEDGRTMALLRPLITAAGGSLDWQGGTGTATVNRHRLVFTLNERMAEINGKSVTLARPLIKMHDRVFAPITLWRDLFSCDVAYDPAKRQVRLHPLPNTAPQTEAP